MHRSSLNWHTKRCNGQNEAPFLAPWIWLEKRPTGQWCLEGPNFWKAVSYRQLQTCIGLLDTSAFFSFTSQLRRICIAALFNQKSAWLNWRTSLKYRDKRKNHQLKVNNLVNGVSCFLPDELVFFIWSHVYFCLLSPWLGRPSVCETKFITKLLTSPPHAWKVFFNTIFFTLVKPRNCYVAHGIYSQNSTKLLLVDQLK